MSRPVVLVHGYSAESRTEDLAAVAKSYGALPDALRARGLVEIDLSRYVSLDDGVGVEDLALALDRALRRDELRHLLESGFDAIVHSTGALVVRAWLRRHSPQPSPLKHLVHLAGAHFGSGWAHVGESIWALAARAALGQSRGLAVLEALELACSWTIDLHHHFLQPGSRLFEDYGVHEFCLAGSQASAYLAYAAPVRYGKEDGSDGVVRVPSANLNWHYLRFEPTPGADRDWSRAASFAREAAAAGPQGRPVVDDTGYYRMAERSRPDLPGRTPAPFALIYHCAHSGPASGIVSGQTTAAQVLRCIDIAIRTATAAEYAAAAEQFERETRETYRRAASEDHRKAALFGLNAAAKLLWPDPRAAYDQHAMVVVRVRDQHGQPVRDCRINFNSRGGGAAPRQLINAAFQDHHQNTKDAGCHAFYLRTDVLGPDGSWRSNLAPVQGVDLEIDSADPRTSRVHYVPLRYRLSSAELMNWVRGNRTVVIDARLLRLPAERTFIVHRTF